MKRIAMALILTATAASAHSWYDSDCCHDRDCAPIPYSALDWQPDGSVVVTLTSADHFMVPPGVTVTGTFGHDSLGLRDSQDGQNHACVVPPFISHEHEAPQTYHIRCLYIASVS
jgi:hypothetical protein